MFTFFGPDTRVDEGGCGTGLLALIGKRGGLSHWMDDRRGCGTFGEAKESKSANRPKPEPSLSPTPVFMNFT